LTDRQPTAKQTSALPSYKNDKGRGFRYDNCDQIILDVIKKQINVAVFQ